MDTNTDIATGTPVLNVEGMTKLYQNGRGAKNITLRIERGDIVGLLGPNGSGKTTTMKVIVGLCHADSGTVEVFGHDIERDYENASKKVGCLIEAPAIFDYLTAYKNLKLAARFYPEVDRQRIEHIMEVVRLERYAKDKTSRYSLGMKQRLGLALALISNPELLVLDEPVNGLDIEGMIEVREIIQTLSQKYGTSFLISSHLAGEIEKVCNKVAVMHESEMLSFDTMQNALKHSPTLEDYYLDRVRERRGRVII